MGPVEKLYHDGLAHFFDFGGIQFKSFLDIRDMGLYFLICEAIDCAGNRIQGIYALRFRC